MQGVLLVDLLVVLDDDGFVVVEDQGLIYLLLLFELALEVEGFRSQVISLLDLLADIGAVQVREVFCEIGLALGGHSLEGLLCGSGLERGDVESHDFTDDN